MSMNRIQFQPGLSLHEFIQRYGTEQQCEDALVAARWPDGFVCSQCGCKKSFCTQNGPLGRTLWECFVCGYQSSSIVGTVFENTKLPLSTWFLGMYLLTQGKNAVSAMELMRQLGIHYKSAWLMKHKLLKVMRLRDEHRLLDGRVELDDAYLGGERAGSEHGGRGALGKPAFVAAVQTSDDARPLRMRMKLIPEFTIGHFRQWAQANLAATAHVVSDGTACFAHCTASGNTHERHVTSRLTRNGRQAAQLPQFRWVNTMLGNIKTAMAGTYHSIRHQKYGNDYLAEFAYRFNRRFDLKALLPRLLHAAASTIAQPLKNIRCSETGS